MLAGSRLFLTYDFTVIPVPMLITARDDDIGYSHLTESVYSECSHI